MSARWSFIGHPLRDDLVTDWPPNIPVREEPAGGYVYRARTEQARCKCSHAQPAHGVDRRGRPTCFGASVCGCTSFRIEDPK
jgi:hypothetical protein